MAECIGLWKKLVYLCCKISYICSFNSYRSQCSIIKPYEHHQWWYNDAIVHVMIRDHYKKIYMMSPRFYHDVMIRHDPPIPSLYCGIMKFVSSRLHILMSSMRSQAFQRSWDHWGINSDSLAYVRTNWNILVSMNGGPPPPNIVTLSSFRISTTQENWLKPLVFKLWHIIQLLPSFFDTQGPITVKWNSTLQNSHHKITVLEHILLSTDMC